MRPIAQARAVVAFAAVAVLGLLLSACGSDTLTATATPDAAGEEDASEAGALVLGNVDATNPSEKIAEFQPLADYLVEHLADPGIEEGRVVIARDTAEMARMLADGEVDIYIDAAIPSLEVCSIAGCDFALRQWKGGEPEMSGIFVTSETSDIETLEDLRGRIIMLEQPHSTVGHILPLVALAELGIPTRSVSGPDAQVADDEVGYYVAPGGQSSMNLLINGEIDAMAVGQRAFNRFSPDVRDQVVVIDRTATAPSQLVTFRPGFDSALEDEIGDLMIALEETSDGQAILESLRDTARFDEFPAELSTELDELWTTVQLVMQE